MANVRVKLLWLCKTEAGYRRYPVLLAQNGRPRTGVVKVNGKEQKYPQGQFQLRYYEGRKAVYKTLGTDPVEALNGLRQFTSVRRLKRDAESEGVELVTSDDAPQTLNTLRGPFMERVTLHNSPSGISGYRIAIDGFLTVSKAVFPADVTPEDLMAYANAQRKDGYAQRTIWNRVARLKSFLKYAGVKDERLPKKHEMPKRPSNPVQVYEQEELDVIIRRSDYGLLWEFLLKTGLREREAMYIEWSDIDLRKRVVEVRNKPELRFRIKTGHGRLVPLEATLADKLAVERVKAVEAKRRFVFGTKNDKPNTKMLRALKREANALGLNCGVCAGCSAKVRECKKWFLHKFRASFATTCLQRGIDLRTLMTLMGHTELKSTMRYLAVARQDALQTKFDSVFGAPSNVVMMPKKRMRKAS